MTQSKINTSPEVAQFAKRCERVRTEVEHRISVVKHSKPVKARAYLWCRWLRGNGFMGVAK